MPPTDRTNRDRLQGSLYPALHRLENRGLLAASWVRTAGGRDARLILLQTAE